MSTDKTDKPEVKSKESIIIDGVRYELPGAVVRFLTTLCIERDYYRDILTGKTLHTIH